MDKRQFMRCQICGERLEKVEFDSPIYCDKCIEHMEKEGVTPEEMMKEKKK